MMYISTETHVKVGSSLPPTRSPDWNQTFESFSHLNLKKF